MPYISYIVPVYNLSEKELSVCIDSILNQSYSDNEIIIVDDGSSNGIESFCDKLSQNHLITVIHQANQGLASARNTGLNAARGEWIVHVDGDDWVDCHLSECLIEKCRTTEADIVVWGYLISTGDRKQELLLKNKKVFEDNYESIKEDVICSVLGSSAVFSSLCLNTSWAKAYRRDFITRNNVYYDSKLRRAQDVVYNLYAFYLAKSVEYIDRALSVYRNDNESLSRGFNPRNIEYLTSTANAVMQFVDNHFKSPKIIRAYNLFIQRCFRMINERTIQSKKNSHSILEKRRIFKTIINQEPFHSAFISGQKRTGVIWYISDLLYEHQFFISILGYNRIISFLYNLKNVFK